MSIYIFFPRSFQNSLFAGLFRLLWIMACSSQKGTPWLANTTLHPVRLLIHPMPFTLFTTCTTMSMRSSRISLSIADVFLNGILSVGIFLTVSVFLMSSGSLSEAMRDAYTKDSYIPSCPLRYAAISMVMRSAPPAGKLLCMNATLIICQGYGCVGHARPHNLQK